MLLYHSVLSKCLQEILGKCLIHNLKFLSLMQLSFLNVKCIFLEFCSMYATSLEFLVLCFSSCIYMKLFEIP